VDRGPLAAAADSAPPTLTPGCCYHRRVRFGLLIAVLVIVALFLAGGVFRYLRQEFQEPRDDSRPKSRK
jgi:hypothetical protein